MLARNWDNNMSHLIKLYVFDLLNDLIVIFLVRRPNHICVYSSVPNLTHIHIFNLS